MTNKLYIARGIEPKIEVWTADTLKPMYNITVPYLQHVGDMTSCPGCNRIFISDFKKRALYVLDEFGVRASWLVPDQPDGISINYLINVLVTYFREGAHNPRVHSQRRAGT